MNFCAKSGILRTYLFLIYIQINTSKINYTHACACPCTHASITSADMDMTIRHFSFDKLFPRRRAIRCDVVRVYTSISGTVQGALMFHSFSSTLFTKFHIRLSAPCFLFMVATAFRKTAVCLSAKDMFVKCPIF